MRSISNAILGLIRWSGWRELVSRLSLPMLALAASWGVYSFALLFVPQWVAVVQAAAFELVYIGLAVARLSPEQQKRARSISLGAVFVSMAYNSLDGLFHRRPALLEAPDLWLDAALSLLHGVPLAALAYLVADLLLHSPQQPTSKATGPSKPQADTNTPKLPEPSKSDTEIFEGSQPTIVLSPGRPKEYSLATLAESWPGNKALTRREMIELLECSEATIDRLIADGLEAGKISQVGRGRYRLGGA